MRGETSMVAFLNQFRIVRFLGLAKLALKLGLIHGNASEYLIAESRWYIEYLLAQQSRYRPALYDGDVQIFRSAQVLNGRLFADELGWKPVVTGTLVVTPVPGLHDQIFRPAGTAVIGKQLRVRLEGAVAESVEAGVGEQKVSTASLSHAGA